MKGLFYKQPT